MCSKIKSLNIVGRGYDRGFVGKERRNNILTTAPSLKDVRIYLYFHKMHRRGITIINVVVSVL